MSEPSVLLGHMSDWAGEDADAAFVERRQRWQERYDGACVFAPVPMWWPWPLERVTVDDGDPDTGLVVVDLEPFLWPGETCADAGRPHAKLVRRRHGEPPYAYGWPGLARMTTEDIAALDEQGEEPELTPVFVHDWQDGRWQWTVFICGVRELTDTELSRIRQKLDPDYQLPQDVSSFRPWA